MRRPLVVIGKGAAYSQADSALRALVDAGALPFLATAMGRGVVPDSHPLNVNPARSAALRGADVALVFGARCVLKNQGTSRRLQPGSNNRDKQPLTVVFGGLQRSACFGISAPLALL